MQRKFKIKDGVLLETTEVRIEDYSKLLKYNMNLKKLADDIRLQEMTNTLRIFC